MAKRIQRKRVKGWKMPEGAVYVGRPTRWGNPFSKDNNPLPEGLGGETWQEQVVFSFAWGLDYLPDDEKEALIAPLRGKDLACWCPLDQPCHADVLLELANETRQNPRNPSPYWHTNESGPPPRWVVFIPHTAAALPHQHTPAVRQRLPA